MTPLDDATFQTYYGRGCTTETDIGSLQKKYCFGIGEGATQAITEQIMECQGISKFYAERPYDDFTPPVYEMIRIFGVDKFARAYFWGEVREFTNAMEFRWGNAWTVIVRRASTKMVPDNCFTVRLIEPPRDLIERLLMKVNLSTTFVTDRSYIFLGLRLTHFEGRQLSLCEDAVIVPTMKDEVN